MSRVDANETAFAHRGWPNDILITSIWTDPAEGEKNIRWTRQYLAAFMESLAESHVAVALAW